jgi:predicted DNA-binding transcriptional regulator AlpA
MHSINGFLRINQIIGDPKANPPIEALIPIGRTAWWDGVKSGRFPKSVKLGKRTTAWKKSDVLKLIDSFGAEG